MIVEKYIFLKLNQAHMKAQKQRCNKISLFQLVLLTLTVSYFSAEQPSIIDLLNDALEGTTDQYLCPVCSVKLTIKQCQMVRLPRYYGFHSYVLHL